MTEDDFICSGHLIWRCRRRDVYVLVGALSEPTRQLDELTRINRVRKYFNLRSGHTHRSSSMHPDV